MATEITTKPNWDLLIQEYSEGASDVEIARLLKITYARFLALCEEVPEFSTFIERGRTLAQAWWYEQGRKNLWNKEFNTTLYNFNMKNRHGWADKVDTNNGSGTDVNLDQAKAALTAALRAVAKTNPELLTGANLHIVKNDHE